MIWDTCAPESENVTTERGWRIISSTWSRFSLASGCTKNSRRSRSSGEVDHRLDRVAARARGRSRPPTRCGPGRVLHQEDPVVVRPARLGADAARRTRPRWPPSTSRRRTSGSRSAARCSSSGRRRSSRHSGSRSNGSRVSNDSSTRQRPAVHLGEHAPAGARRLLEQVEVRRARNPARARRAEHAPRDRHAGLHREVAQAAEVVASGGRDRGPVSSPAISKMPPPRSPITPTSSRTSSHVAMRLATGRRRRSRGCACATW